MIENKSTFLFPQPITNVDKTTRFTAGFVYNLSDLTRDEITTINCKLVALFKNYHYCNSLPITILQFIISLKLLLNIEK